MSETILFQEGVKVLHPVQKTPEQIAAEALDAVSSYEDKHLRPLLKLKMLNDEFRPGMTAIAASDKMFSHAYKILYDGSIYQGSNEEINKKISDAYDPEEVKFMKFLEDYYARFKDFVPENKLPEVTALLNGIDPYEEDQTSLAIKVSNFLSELKASVSTGLDTVLQKHMSVFSELSTYYGEHSLHAASGNAFFNKAFEAYQEGVRLMNGTDPEPVQLNEFMTCFSQKMNGSLAANCSAILLGTQNEVSNPVEKACGLSPYVSAFFDRKLTGLNFVNGKVHQDFSYVPRRNADGSPLSLAQIFNLPEKRADIISYRGTMGGLFPEPREEEIQAQLEKAKKPCGVNGNGSKHWYNPLTWFI